MEDVSCIPNAKSEFKGDLEVEGLNNFNIEEGLILKKLSELNVSKTPGPDSLHPKLLQELRIELSKPLTALFKLSVDSGVIPQDWKEAIVSPLFKKGSKAKPENYRPVSLTSIIGKILESIIKDHIVSHLNKFQLIHNRQHGFTKGRSCLTNLLEFMEGVTSELDRKNSVDLVYLDFAKAFDKVPYKRLAKKLQAHGLG